jgi:hypothetical protein
MNAKNNNDLADKLVEAGVSEDFSTEKVKPKIKVKQKSWDDTCVDFFRDYGKSKSKHKGDE